MKNSLELVIKRQIKIIWVTDGSDDGTPDLLQNYPNTTVHHLQERNGKIGAMNRGMEFVKHRL
jgi:glycosyltransferase involved in cell wall biosynthesis